jgi:hypothetical protein
MREPVTRELTFTHILQIDFVKELAKTTYIVEAGRASALSSRFPCPFPKMWVKVRHGRGGCTQKSPSRTEQTAISREVNHVYQSREILLGNAYRASCADD